MKNKEWIEEEFKDFDCGDKQLNRRFLQMTKAMALSPDETINKSLLNFAEPLRRRVFSLNAYFSQSSFDYLMI